MACLYVWARAIRDNTPMLVIVENVPRFPVALLMSLFGDLYAVDWVILDAKDIGAPARRRRLYVVMTLRGKLRLTRPLADLVAVIKRVYPVSRAWECLFCLSDADDCFSKPVAKRAKRYLLKFRDRDGAYDLDQLPDGRPRHVAAGRPLVGLTAHTRMVWSPNANRCLRRSELAAVMGVPCHPALSIAYGLPPLSFDHLSRSAAARLIGNGMCVPCVGSVMHWCSVFCSPDVVDVPRSLVGVSVDDQVVLEIDDRVYDGYRDVPGHAPASASATTWKVLRALGFALCKHPMFAELTNSLKFFTRPLDRERELFPLPIIPVDYIGKFGGFASDDIEDVREYLLGVVVALNTMYGFRGHGLALGIPTAAQRTAHDVIITSAIDLHSRLVASFDSRIDGCLSNFEDKGDARALRSMLLPLPFLIARLRVRRHP